MHQLLDALSELSFAFLEQTAREIDEQCPRQFAEFVSVMVETFVVILPQKENFSPVELADCLLNAMPSEHPVYHPDSLKKLELIFDIFEKLDIHKGREAFLLSELSQAVETQRIKLHISSYITDLNRYKKRLTDMIRDKVEEERTNRSVMNRFVELKTKIEEGGVDTPLFADDVLLEELKSKDLFFRLLCEKLDGVDVLLAILNKKQRSWEKLYLFEMKLAEYSPLFEQSCYDQERWFLSRWWQHSKGKVYKWGASLWHRKHPEGDASLQASSVNVFVPDNVPK